MSRYYLDSTGEEIPEQLNKEMSSPSGEANTASNVGDGNGIFKIKSGVDLQFKSLFSGSGMHIAVSGNSLVFNATAAGHSHSVEADFTNASGVWTAADQTNAINISTLQTDFSNSSGIFQAGTNIAYTVNTNFTNSSGIFRSDINAVEITANSVRSDFDNASGVWTNDISATTSVANGVRTDFDNASGIYVKSAESAGGTTLIKTGTAPALSFKGLVSGSGLRIIVGANDITIGRHCPSGDTLPSLASTSFGEEFYHSVSGFMRRGQYEWEQQSDPLPHVAMWWMDTTPVAGQTILLPTANTYVRFAAVAASGAQYEGHGLQASTSGIKVIDEESEGHYLAHYTMSFDGSVNTNFYTALFIGSTRLRETTCVSRLSGASDITNTGSQAIISLNKDDEISLRCAAGTNSKQISVHAMNVTINRIHKHID